VPAPLNASATTVGSLMASSTFQIPAYQREYAWGKLEVTEFWDDLSHALALGPYFLGLIILTGEDKRKQVVDGQQRLLSITLLAAALRHAAIDVGRKALADQIQSTILRSLDYATDEVYPRIILTDPRANKTLQSIIDKGAAGADLEVEDGSSSRRLWEAYTYFRDQLPSGADIFRQLGTWAEFINEQLYVAVFDHPDEAAAYSVFEVVNTRGKQLTTADLLKNYVLRETPEERRDERYQQWYRMTEEFEQVGSQNFVQFIRHVINLRAGYILPKDLYNYISRRGEFAGAAVSSVDELMDQLQSCLPLYLQLVDPTTDGPAESSTLDIFVALNDLGVSAVRPLLLAISTTKDPTSGMSQVLRMIVKRMVVGNLGASSVERRFAEAARIVHEQNSWLAGLRVLREMEHSRDEFITQLTRRSYNRNILAFIRRSIVFQTVTPATVGTLQYLRPRQPLGNTWPEFTDEDQAFWGSTLGNSILVNIEKRPRGANTWTGVRERLLPRAIPEESVGSLLEYETWDPTAVEQVGNLLAEAAARVWY
jgi:Protein of unknown function DUF262